MLFRYHRIYLISYGILTSSDRDIKKITDVKIKRILTSNESSFHIITKPHAASDVLFVCMQQDYIDHRFRHWLGELHLQSTSHAIAEPGLDNTLGNIYIRPYMKKSTACKENWQAIMHTWSQRAIFNKAYVTISNHNIHHVSWLNKPARRYISYHLTNIVCAIRTLHYAEIVPVNEKLFICKSACTHRVGDHLPKTCSK